MSRFTSILCMMLRVTAILTTIALLMFSGAALAVAVA